MDGPAARGALAFDDGWMGVYIRFFGILEGWVRKVGVVRDG